MLYAFKTLLDNQTYVINQVDLVIPSRFLFIYFVCFYIYIVMYKLDIVICI